MQAMRARGTQPKERAAAQGSAPVVTKCCAMARRYRAASARAIRAGVRACEAGVTATASQGRGSHTTTEPLPGAGTVRQRAMYTEHHLVTDAQALMVIAPDSASVSGEVTLENKDIGFVSPGQDVAIKLETFTVTRYGTVNATVEKVKQDAVDDEKRGAIFPATLKLNQTRIDMDGRQIKLAPGMNITAEIKTGQRRVNEFLLSPIQKAGSESLRKRWLNG